ncbi:MAG: methyltransferase domain-containing protein [Methanomicrobiaceae archaeon]|nr:methyltransferase domain-containing protein [Methanomicrobiaceae archaeon]
MGILPETRIVWGRALLETLTLKGDERVLDLGCRDGMLTAEIAVRLPRGSVTGVDSHQEMIEAARDRFPEAEFRNLSFVFAPGELPFHHEFDLVFSVFAFRPDQDPLPLLQGISSSLRRTGRFLMQTGWRIEQDDIQALLDDMIVQEPWSRFFPGSSLYREIQPRELNSLLHFAGLYPRRVECTHKELAFSGRGALMDWMERNWRGRDRIPPARLLLFLEEFADHCFALHPPDMEGTVRLPVWLLEIDAEKG